MRKGLSLCCLQSVKDTKFESNSQQNGCTAQLSLGCLQSVKDTKFESNSQPMRFVFPCLTAVCSPSKIQSLKAIHNFEDFTPAQILLFAVRQRYKVWKQFTTRMVILWMDFRLFAVRQRYKVWKQFTTQQRAVKSYRSCLQSVKDTKFESNSQLLALRLVWLNAVCSPSKIQSLKAIHNGDAVYRVMDIAVCSPSKIQSLKAIHNGDAVYRVMDIAVCSPSKIQSLKAIHNSIMVFKKLKKAVCSPSKIQSLKAIHNTWSISVLSA